MDSPGKGLGIAQISAAAGGGDAGDSHIETHLQKYQAEGQDCQVGYGHFSALVQIEEQTVESHQQNIDVENIKTEFLRHHYLFTQEDKGYGAPQASHNLSHRDGAQVVKGLEAHGKQDDNVQKGWRQGRLLG